ncbi:unnamed protein product [Sympodiomycopsis kandeliae]
MDEQSIRLPLAASDESPCKHAEEAEANAGAQGSSKSKDRLNTLPKIVLNSNGTPPPPKLISLPPLSTIHELIQEEHACLAARDEQMYELARWSPHSIYSEVTSTISYPPPPITLPTSGWSEAPNPFIPGILTSSSARIARQHELDFDQVMDIDPIDYDAEPSLRTESSLSRLGSLSTVSRMPTMTSRTSTLDTSRPTTPVLPPLFGQAHIPTLSKYGLDSVPPILPPLSDGATVSTRPIAALSHQRQHFRQLLAEHVPVVRFARTTHGTDVSPALVAPHLGQIRVLKEQRKWDAYWGVYASIDETSRQRKRIEAELAQSGASVGGSHSATESSDVNQSIMNTLQQRKRRRRQKTPQYKELQATMEQSEDTSLEMEIGRSSAPLKSDASLTLPSLPDISLAAHPSDLFDAATVHDSSSRDSLNSNCPQSINPQVLASDLSGQSTSQAIDPSYIPASNASDIVQEEDSSAVDAQAPINAKSSLFPRRDYSLGREASQPPPFRPGLEAECMRPRFQPAKFPGDLYTPAIVRAGKSSGKGDAAGDIGSKEGWCGLCPPIESVTNDRQRNLIGGWLNLRNSSYRYHLIRVHGISPKTYVPFQEPTETVVRDAKKELRVGEGTELRGKCHQCENWIPFGLDEATNFYVHAAKCHREDPASVQASSNAAHSAADDGKANAQASSSSKSRDETSVDPSSEAVGAAGDEERRALRTKNLNQIPPTTASGSNIAPTSSVRKTPVKRSLDSIAESQEENIERSSALASTFMGASTTTSTGKTGSSQGKEMQKVGRPRKVRRDI